MSNSQDYARELLYDGCCVTLYWRESLLDEALKHLSDEQFFVYDFDCSYWNDVSTFHDAVSAKMNFPDYYGCNLDAFNDSFGDAVVTDRLGVVISLRHYDHFHKRNADVSKVILDIMQSNAWHCLVAEKLLAVLIQSDDPRLLESVQIGATTPDWNRDEWLNKDRGL